MANNKTEAGWIDIPIVSGGTQRVHFVDEDARAAIEGLPSQASTQTCEDIITELI